MKYMDVKRFSFWITIICLIWRGAEIEDHVENNGDGTGMTMVKYAITVPLYKSDFDSSHLKTLFHLQRSVWTSSVMPRFQTCALPQIHLCAIMDTADVEEVTHITK